MVRFKSRWFLVEFLPYHEPGQPIPANEPEITSYDISHGLRESIIQHFGDDGWGSVGDSLQVKYFSPITNICIIRIGRNNHRTVWGGITLMTALKNRPCIPHVLHVSGTLKKTQLATIKYNRVLVARIQARSAGSDRAYEWEQFLARNDKQIENIDG